MSDLQPWIDSLINERYLLESIAGTCTRNGWEKVAEFTKIVYPASLTKPIIKRLTLPLGNPVVTLSTMVSENIYIFLDGAIMPYSNYSIEKKNTGSYQVTFKEGVSGDVAIYYSDMGIEDIVEIQLAKHIIIKNSTGNLFGMAVRAVVTGTMGETACPVPFAIYDVTHRNPYGTQLILNDESVFDWAKGQAEKYNLYQANTLYLYQLEKFDAVSSSEYIFGWEDKKELKRAVLDIEVLKSMWGLEGDVMSLKFKITEQNTEYMQSPIVQARTRIPQLESVDNQYGIKVPYTNWWEDSQVKLTGYIDEKSLMFILLADTAPSWEDNSVPAIPIYMGDFDVKGQEDEIVKRNLVFDLYKADTKKSTVISSKPMTNTGATVKVYLMGDVNDDANNLAEYVQVNVGGKEINKFRTMYATQPTSNKADAEYLGEFPLDNIEGKNSVDIEVISTEFVSGYSPVAARIWVDIVIPTTTNKKGTAALFAGTAFNLEGETAEKALKGSGQFDYDNPDSTNFQETLQPLLKNYPLHPSNGIDTVMVKRTKYGAYYQSHYLSWNTPSNISPPNRQDVDNHKHPRAWDNYMNQQYKYQFSPSRYSGKAHASKALLIHPEDGDHGTLRNVILLSPLTIMNSDELKVKDEYCAVEGKDKYKFYSYYLTEGISPLTKRPATPYRPAGLGILRDGEVLLPRT